MISTAHFTAGPTARQRILVVEDDRGFREALRAVLVEAGFSVSATGNGAEALALIERDGTPSVIILDMEMPVMNGWKFRAALKKDPRLRHTPVIVVSGHVQNQVLAHPGGVEFVLRKPIAPADLLAYVGRYVRRSA